MSSSPDVTSQTAGATRLLLLSGSWTLAASGALEAAARQIVSGGEGASGVVIDLDGVERLDTAGAWLISAAQHALGVKGGTADIRGGRPEFAILLEEARYRRFDPLAARHGWVVVDLLVDLGRTMTVVGRDILSGVSALGEVIAIALATVLRPRRFRLTSIVYHLESFGFRSVPIIALINFLVGCIVAQQGIFQLRRFGAATFAVDLIGILVLRELAVLLTAIMMAGRTGSAITAEIGAMKMREEIDALRVMGLDPVEVLVLPRMIALAVALPLLTFLADMSAIFGGLLVAWGYEGISPAIYMARLQDAIALNTFLVGLIKAPVMAVVIGMISAIEGFSVKGSAESLGSQVTASVVKSIFMVIVVDGLFAMFFAAINY